MGQAVCWIGDETWADVLAQCFVETDTMTSALFGMKIIPSDSAAFSMSCFVSFILEDEPSTSGCESSVVNGDDEMEVSTEQLVNQDIIDLDKSVFHSWSIQEAAEPIAI
ncbi:aspartate aminotransferase family protein, partial [Vibrio sp. 10N.222.48.A8]